MLKGVMLLNRPDFNGMRKVFSNDKTILEAGN